MTDRKIDIDSLIKSAEIDKDYETIFSYLAMLLESKNYTKVIEIINRNLDGLAKHNQIMVMDMHFYVLLEQERFVDAMNALRYYEQLPYVSQEVEQRVKELGEIIKNVETESKLKRKYSNKKKVSDILNYSRDVEEIFEVIYYLRTNKKIPKFINEISNILKDKERNLPNASKALIFMFLVEENLDLTLEVSLDNDYTLKTKEFVPFYKDEVYLETEKVINKLIKNITVINFSIQLLHSFVLITFPNYYINKDNINLYVLSFYEITNRYLGNSDDFSNLYKELNLDKNEVEDTIKFIEEQLKKDSDPASKN